MTITVGTRLGTYDVLALIGSGGMGQVYRARDTKLNRDVALKILPPEFTHDPDRVARFRREAQVLASLNHPNIAQIYGFEEGRDGPVGRVGLVGQPESTLGFSFWNSSRDRRSRRSLLVARLQTPGSRPGGAGGQGLPVADALSVARQIADALEAAHEQGIIHRDLKPANVKVRSDGIVKVLDFGLAKAFAPEPGGSVGDGMANSPALSMQATQAGLILGTAAYMSPEQASGKPVDKRSDLWAFGVVLMEILTGRPVFAGETISHVLASVLKTDPDWTTLPADTPAPIRKLLRRCLEKDRKRRLADASDARLEIDEALNGPTSSPEVIKPASAWSRWAVPAAPVVSGLALGVVGTAWFALRPAPSHPPVRLFATSPSDLRPPRRLRPEPLRFRRTVARSCMWPTKHRASSTCGLSARGPTLRCPAPPARRDRSSLPMGSGWDSDREPR